MEPVNLTCPRCGAAWKLIKAGKGPVTCSQCKAALDAALAEPSPEPKAPESEPPTSTATPAAAETSPEPPPLPALSSVPLPPVADVDDPTLIADYDDRPAPQRRRGMAPLLRVAIILVALMILVPVGLIILLLVACAVMLARG
jgi:hypothetical protein